MNIIEFKKIIQERCRIADECNDEWLFGIENCWKKEIEILSQDIPSTISFLRNNCTADEYSWISEIIEDLAEHTQNRELIVEYKNLMSKYPEEYKKYNISKSVNLALDLLNDEVNNDKEN